MSNIGYLPDNRHINTYYYLELFPNLMIHSAKLYQYLVLLKVNWTGPVLLNCRHKSKENSSYNARLFYFHFPEFFAYLSLGSICSYLAAVSVHGYLHCVVNTPVLLLMTELQKEKTQ